MEENKKDMEYHSSKHTHMSDNRIIRYKATYKKMWLGSFVLIYIDIYCREGENISNVSSEELSNACDMAKRGLFDWYKELQIPENLNTKIKFTGIIGEESSKAYSSLEK